MTSRSLDPRAIDQKYALHNRSAHPFQVFAGLLPVYAASEDPRPGVDSGLIAGHLADKGLARVALLPGPEAIPGWLDAEAPAGSLVLTLGAGDIGRRVGDICAHLDGRAGR